MKVVLVGILLTIALAYKQHLNYDSSAGAGQTPATLVENYLKMAYKQGKPQEAEQNYFAPGLAAKETAFIGPVEGQPTDTKILSIIAQGENVAVRHRIMSTEGAPTIDAVDLYQVHQNRIAAHDRVAQPNAVSPASNGAGQ